MKLPFPFLLLTFGLAASAHSATLVDDNFNYSDGQLISSANWNGNVNSQSNYVIAANELSVVQGAGADFTAAVNQNSFNFGTYSSATASVDFSFTDLTSRVSNVRIFGVSIGDNNFNTAGNYVTAYLRRGGTTGFVVRLESNFFTDAQSAFISASDFGITYDSDLDSDNLRLSIQMDKGATTANWSAVATVTNLTTSTVVGSWTVNDFTTASGIFDGTTSMYASMNTANRDVSALTGTNFTVTAIPEPSTSGLLIGVLGALTLVRRRRA